MTVTYFRFDFNAVHNNSHEHLISFKYNNECWHISRASFLPGITRSPCLQFSCCLSSVLRCYSLPECFPSPQRCFDRKGLTVEVETSFICIWAAAWIPENSSLYSAPGSSHGTATNVIQTCDYKLKGVQHLERAVQLRDVHRRLRRTEKWNLFGSVQRILQESQKQSAEMRSVLAVVILLTVLMSCFMNLNIHWVSGRICNDVRKHARVEVKEFWNGVFFTVDQMKAGSRLNANSFDGLDLNKW